MWRNFLHFRYFWYLRSKNELERTNFKGSIFFNKMLDLGHPENISSNGRHQHQHLEDNSRLESEYVFSGRGKYIFFSFFFSFFFLFSLPFSLPFWNNQERKVLLWNYATFLECLLYGIHHLGPPLLFCLEDSFPWNIPESAIEVVVFFFFERLWNSRKHHLPASILALSPEVWTKFLSISSRYRKRAFV